MSSSYYGTRAQTRVVETHKEEEEEEEEEVGNVDDEDEGEDEEDELLRRMEIGAPSPSSRRLEGIGGIGGGTGYPSIKKGGKGGSGGGGGGGGGPGYFSIATHAPFCLPCYKCCASLLRLLCLFVLLLLFPITLFLFVMAHDSSSTKRTPRIDAVLIDVTFSLVLVALVLLLTATTRLLLLDCGLTRASLRSSWLGLCLSIDECLCRRVCALIGCACLYAEHDA